jgi:hypothetical protein
MRTCLWLARTMPYPRTSGDRIYTGKLAEALAASGTAITFMGLAGGADPEPVNNIAWHIVPGAPRSLVGSLLSTLPLVSARHATTTYRAEVMRELRGRTWDVVVIDQYGMGWTLADIQLRSRRSLLVFVAHDHEESITRQQWRSFSGGRLLERLYHLQNYLKTRRSERQTTRACDLITAITDDDATMFRQTARGVDVVTLTPGYDGPHMQARNITADTPRAAVMFGSYRWSAKQKNLKAFLECADSRLHKSGIEMRIVGDIAENVRLALERQYASTRFTGFVLDPAVHLNARLAIVAETIGGGFKLKLLDYIFNRIPIVALDTCIVGLPESVRRHTLIAANLSALIDIATSVIDDVALLDRLQRDAYNSASDAFDWAQRGTAMHDAIDAASRARSASEGLRLTDANAATALSPSLVRRRRAPT